MPLISRTGVFKEARVVDPSTPGMGKNRVGSLSLLLLSVWCGLVAGLLEVSTIVLRKRVFDPDQLYKTSRHFIWMIPLINLGVFLALGLVGCCIVLIWPNRGRWLVTRGLAAITVLPSFLVAFPRIYSLAWLLVALGLAAQLVPRFETSSRRLRRIAIMTFPVLMAIVACLWASLWIGDRIKQSRENARALPPPESPNVLLIVLDTVAAGHLSLHGYNRATSPTLLELAERGIRFDTARAGLVMDAAVPCDHVYWAVDARALGRLVHAARPSPAYLGRVPGRPRLRYGWIRREYVVLRSRFRTVPRFHSLSGFQLSGAYRAQDDRAGQSRFGSFPHDLLLHGRLVGIHWTAFLSSTPLEICWTSIARGRRWSIASSLVGCRSAHSQNGRFSLF